MINFSTRRVGGLRFIKLGRLCFSFCITKEYKRPDRLLYSDTTHSHTED